MPPSNSDALADNARRVEAQPSRGCLRLAGVRRHQSPNKQAFPSRWPSNGQLRSSCQVPSWAHQRAVPRPAWYLVGGMPKRQAAGWAPIKLSLEKSGRWKWLLASRRGYT